MSANSVPGARRTRRILLTLLALTGVGVSAVVAWNTQVENGLIDLGWEAVYVGNPQAASLPGSGWTENEHTELTHVVLKELGVDAVFGMEPVGSSNTTVVDLNGVFQPQVLTEEKQGDNMATLLEERNVPPPAHFAGLPDYSFAMHDWINKNTHCPLDPATYAYADCHQFKGWMGNLNANHFGTQARNMYTRYHLLALNLAQRAKTMRLLLDLHPLEATAYADFVKEAELEALIYEAIGQHFLEDRWATGHMWERWNGADQETSALYPLAMMVAAAAGLMHGSEGITKLPDPMGSPLVVTQGGEHAVPVQWRIPGLPPQPGVGDYRLEDMHDGNFGGEFGFSQMPIAVTDQKNRMIACSKAGWSEVIEAFGVTTPGHYGRHDVTLTQTSFPPIVDEDNDCWNAWATNEAMRQGWEAHPATESIRLEARTLEQIAATQGVAELRERLLPHVETTWRVASVEALGDPDGTFLARGGIGSFNVDPQGLGVTSGDVKVGKGFRVPTYAEPQNLDGLLTVDPQGRGRDKHALYGFFNRSHADWWCQNLQTELATLRGSPALIRREACSYIANRAYKGTDPAYKGAKVEKREFMNQESDPICKYYGVETASLNESIPYFLHPGYVATPESQTVAAHGYDSVENWCLKVPVIDRMVCPGPAPPDGDAKWDVVARTFENGGTVTIQGRNFGTTPGTVKTGSAEDALPFTLQTGSWSDTQIQFTVPQDLLTAGDWFLQVCPFMDMSRCSVGRFILRVGADGPLFLRSSFDSPTSKVGPTPARRHSASAPEAAIRAATSTSTTRRATSPSSSRPPRSRATCRRSTAGRSRSTATCSASAASTTTTRSRTTATSGSQAVARRRERTWFPAITPARASAIRPRTSGPPSRSASAPDRSAYPRRPGARSSPTSPRSG